MPKSNSGQAARITTVEQKNDIQGHSTQCKKIAKLIIWRQINGSIKLDWWAIYGHVRFNLAAIFKILPFLKIKDRGVAMQPDFLPTSQFPTWQNFWSRNWQNRELCHFQYQISSSFPAQNGRWGRIPVLTKEVSQELKLCSIVKDGLVDI